MGQCRQSTPKKPLSFSFLFAKTVQKEIRFDVLPVCHRFFLESFVILHLLLTIDFYYKINISINFWCRQKLNSKYLIQPSETLLIHLTQSHFSCSSLLQKQRDQSNWVLLLFFFPKYIQEEIDYIIAINPIIFIAYSHLL